MEMKTVLLIILFIAVGSIILGYFNTLSTNLGLDSNTTATVQDVTNQGINILKFGLVAAIALVAGLALRAFGVF